MSPLHAAGLGHPATTWTAAGDLKKEDKVFYDRRVWTVREVLPEVFGAVAVIATHDATGRPLRTVLMYANPHSLAEVLVP